MRGSVPRAVRPRRDVGLGLWPRPRVSAMVSCSSVIESWSGSGGVCTGRSKATEVRWSSKGRLGSARRSCWRPAGIPQSAMVSGCCEHAAPSWNGSLRSGLCANRATGRPLALVVDDAHWADAASLRFLAFLLPRLEELHAAVLLGARPAEAGASRELLAALTMDPATEVVTVGPLTPRGVATLVAAGLGVEPEPEFAAACWEATGGTPFLVRTLIEALREERIAPVTASAAAVHNLATYDLERWVMLRLERLGPDAACLARAVAVLERADLLVRAGVLEEAPLGFAHPLLRAAVYRDMAVVKRADAHARAAMLLSETHASGARVAEHLLSTAPAGDDWTVEQLRAAAREASARGAPESAIAYLRRALSEPPSREVGPGLLLELGTAEFSAGQAGWHDHLEAAVESARDDTTRTAAALWFANALRFHQRLAESVEVCDGVAGHLDRRDVDGRLVLEAMAVNCGMIDATTAPQVGDRAPALL